MSKKSDLLTPLEVKKKERAAWESWDFWDPEKDPLPKKANRFRRISICTNCMNRLYDLKETLPKNIEDNIDYPNVEFVVLNYNSKDEMDEWMRKNMMEFIRRGIVNYYHTTEPTTYEMGHSRNVAFKLATGEIVNQVDADNFTNKGFAHYVNRQAEVQPQKALFCKGKRQTHGRIGLYRHEWLELGGYDEDLRGYGYDDHSVILRAMESGFRMMWWADDNFCKRIPTSDKQRVENMYDKSKRRMENINRDATWKKLDAGRLTVNEERHWGKATVIKNWEQEIRI